MRTIRIGADELILWLRKNHIAEGSSNRALGTRILNIIERLGGIKEVSSFRSVWTDEVASRNRLPKESAQYDINTSILESLYDRMSEW
jgi:hypothetical protein